MSTCFGHHYALSGIIMPIIRRTRVWTVHMVFWLWWLWLCGAGTQAVCTVKVHTARVPAPHNHSHHNQCRTPFAAVHTLVLLMMGIMVPETCWDKSVIINIRLVASCWFLSLHPKKDHVWRGGGRFACCLQWSDHRCRSVVPGTGTVADMHSAAVCHKYRAVPSVCCQKSNIYKYRGKVKLCSHNPKRHVGHGGIAPLILKLSIR